MDLENESIRVVLVEGQNVEELWVPLKQGHHNPLLPDGMRLEAARTVVADANDEKLLCKTSISWSQFSLYGGWCDERHGTGYKLYS
ncbi:uncharacterized protein ACA1_336940 [Acanthamoeba castellanii str. Neff]|uniref:Uncharacterized protein n=1 Tax=Acanthamoeba castellanii (strain ATCC 30010 / Neff) TaxID=1257118 RepID=L8GVY0_ACACF|nr:uncharacterized protein ACA1_336940 [Acanthamoeba castellanii str. Neff]ELR16241.1 hypothetical protein ACA1_336940 [Acanthamoeba castellanii str. Neff]